MQRQQLHDLHDTYNVEQTLGCGGFSVVRMASLRSDGLPCALKSISKGSTTCEEHAETEANALQGLCHPNICKLLHVCEDAGHTHLVLEYVRGHELWEEIAEERPLNDSRAACIMRQIFAGLQYCHGLSPGVIHRDLKLENIMVADGVDNEPDVKIIDWGLAVSCHDTMQSAIVGTDCYLAPESLLAGIYSRASDMWTVGTVLHILLTGGAFPHQFATSGHTSRLKTSLLQEAAASKAAVDLLQNLLKGSSNQRLTAAAAGKHAWTAGLDAELSSSVGECNSSELGREEVLQRADDQIDSREEHTMSILIPSSFEIFDDFKDVQASNTNDNTGLHSVSYGIDEQKRRCIEKKHRCTENGNGKPRRHANRAKTALAQVNQATVFADARLEEPHKCDRQDLSIVEDVKENLGPGVPLGLGTNVKTRESLSQKSTLLRPIPLCSRILS
jgi:serine/threonine protein kinase